MAVDGRRRGREAVGIVWAVDAGAALVLGAIDDSASSFVVASVYLGLLVMMPMAVVASVGLLLTRKARFPLLVSWASLAAAWIILLPATIDADPFVARVGLGAHIVAGLAITAACVRAPETRSLR